MSKLVEFYKNHLKIFLVVILAAVGAGIFIGYDYLSMNNLAARVGPFEITKQQVKERVWYNKQFQGELSKLKPSQKESKLALDELIEHRLLEAEADKLKISLNDAELNKAIRDKKLYPDTLPEPQRRITKAAIKAIILKDLVTNKTVSVLESQEVIIRFSRWYFDDRAKFDADKEYGKQVANEIYNDIKSGNLSFKDAREKVKANERVGILPFQEAYGYNNVGFGEDVTAEQFVVQPDGPYKKLLLASAEGLNEPRLLSEKIVNPLSSDDKKVDVEAAWIIVNVHKLNTGQHGNYADWLKSAREKYPVRIY